MPEDHRLHLRMLEAMLFAAAQPMSRAEISLRMPEGIDLDRAADGVAGEPMPGRGVILRRTDDRWAFRTAEDLAFVLKREVVQEKKLSRAAVETLAVIAYHQPATRAEIEEVRGVAVSPGTLDVLLETGWIRLRGRRRTPGRPVTFGTTPAFLDHFGLELIGDLPGLADLRAAGLIETLANARRGDAGRPTTVQSCGTTRIRWSWISPVSTQRRTRPPKTDGGRVGDDARRTRTATDRARTDARSFTPVSGKSFWPKRLAACAMPAHKPLHGSHAPWPRRAAGAPPRRSPRASRWRR